MDFQDMRQVEGLAKRIHLQNRGKGFWDTPNSVHRQVNLIVSEFVEAMEADRKKRMTKAIDLEYVQKYIQSNNSVFATTRFKQSIKNTIEDEFADAWIRIVDWHYWLTNDELDRNFKQFRLYNENEGISCFKVHKDDRAYHKYHIPKIDFSFAHIPNAKKEDNFDSFIYGSIWRTINIIKDVGWLNILRCRIEKYCESKGIDLHQHIQIKMLYNKHRPKMHNKKY